MKRSIISLAILWAFIASAALSQTTGSKHSILGSNGPQANGRAQGSSHFAPVSKL
jgi:hypothetical protein